MHPFYDYVYQRFRNHMRSWPQEIAHNICVMACMIGFDEDDPRRGFIFLSATTDEFWAGTFTPNEKEPGQKWHTVTVSPLDILTICEGSGEWYGSDDPGDIECVTLRDDYFRSLGIFMSDQEKKQWYPLLTKEWRAKNNQGTMTAEEKSTLVELESRLAALPKAFIDVCANSVQRLFESGTITEICGKPVPVIFCFGNDMGDENHLSRRMREVNPPGLTEEYYQWRKKHYSGLG